MSYLVLGLVMVAACAVVALITAARRRLGGRWWAPITVTAVVLVVLTIVFDSIMIAADLFRFEEAHLIGVRIGLAPVEDLAWPVAAALLLPSVQALLRRDARPERTTA